MPQAEKTPEQIIKEGIKKVDDHNARAKKNEALVAKKRKDFKEIKDNPLEHVSTENYRFSLNFQKENGMMSAVTAAELTQRLGK